MKNNQITINEENKIVDQYLSEAIESCINFMKDDRIMADYETLFYYLSSYFNNLEKTSKALNKLENLIKQ